MLLPGFSPISGFSFLAVDSSLSEGLSRTGLAAALLAAELTFGGGEPMVSPLSSWFWIKIVSFWEEAGVYDGFNNSSSFVSCTGCPSTLASFACFYLDYDIPFYLVVVTFLILWAYGPLKCSFSITKSLVGLLYNISSPAVPLVRSYMIFCRLGIVSSFLFFVLEWLCSPRSIDDAVLSSLPKVGSTYSFLSWT